MPGPDWEDHDSSLVLRRDIQSRHVGAHVRVGRVTSEHQFSGQRSSGAHVTSVHGQARVLKWAVIDCVGLSLFPL